MLDEKENSISHRRPGCLVILAAIFTLYQTLSTFRVLQQAKLFEASYSLAFALQALIAAGWALVFAVLLVAALRRNPTAVRYGGMIVIGFVVFRVLRYAIFAQADYDRHRLLFIIVATLSVLAVPTIGLLRQVRRHND